MLDRRSGFGGANLGGGKGSFRNLRRRRWSCSRSRLRDGDRTNELVAAPRQGAQQLMPRVAKGAADLLDALGDAVVRHNDVGPHGLHDLVAANDATRVLD